MTTQAEIDVANSRFWNFICGSTLLGPTRPSIQRYDRAYLKMYPWLKEMVIVFVGSRGQSQKVLEVGPGYGTVGRLVRAQWADYWALDIAPAVVTHSLATTGGNAIVGSVLELDRYFEAESFDKAIAIGSLHHTGNLPLAVQQIHRVLKPGGKALVMVYGDGDVHDFHPETGEAAPWTDVVPPEEIPSLFSAFTAIDVTLKTPHAHTDVYIEAVK